MNRKNKRELIHSLKKKGYSQADIDKAIEIKTFSESQLEFKEGDKVKLNIHNIESHKDYLKLKSTYKTWVQAHKNDIFTIEYDKNFSNNPSVVCLKEDKTNPKWLFHVSNLELVSGYNNV